MFQFFVNGVNMAFDLRKMKLYDRGQVYKLNSNPAQVNGRVYFKLTDSCNLSCIYCFQNNDSKSGINPINIADFKAAVCELLCRKNTDFYMFGGEPFLDSQYENVLYLLNNSDVTFHVFTNGCFSQSYRDLISHFQDRLIPIITLDGPKEIHNKRRRKGQTGSFDEIIGNIDYLQSINANWICQINIDDGNFDEIDNLFAFLHSRYHINEIDTILNPVLHCATSHIDLKLLQKYVHLDSLYHLERCIINCKTARKLSALLSGNGVSKSRCDIENTYVADFENNILYCCPQNSKSLIGTVNSSGIHIDKSGCSYLFSMNQKRNKPCSRCEYNHICGRGCFMDKPDYTFCKQEVEEVVLYYFKHANCFLHLAN